MPVADLVVVRADVAVSASSMKSLLIVAGLFASLALWAQPIQTQAATIPNFVIGAVAEVTAYSAAPFDENSSMHQGSGVFVDHGGCVYTNAHVVLNLETGEQVPYLGVAVAKDRARAPEFLYSAEVVFVDPTLDLAYICPFVETGIFTEYFDRFAEPHFEERAFGEDHWVLGYPSGGEGTVTVSPGNIVGFIQGPDVTYWSGLGEVDPEQLKLYKSDALAGPGVSGGIMIDSEYRLMGVPFAGTVLPGGFLFVLSEDVYLEFERRLDIHRFAQGLVPLDCVMDKESGYFLQSGVQFYDRQCRFAREANMEFEVKNTYKAFCSVDISQARMMEAIRRSKELGDLSAWSDSVLARCQNIMPSSDSVSPKASSSRVASLKKSSRSSNNSNMSNIAQ